MSKKEKMTAVWIDPFLHGWIKKCSLELKCSNKELTERAFEDYISRHPALYHLFEQYMLGKKENQ